MNKNQIHPNFFIIAPERSGSTSLFEYLKKHPQIFLSPIKEPNYFSQDMFLDERRTGESKPLLKFLNSLNRRDWNRGYTAIINDLELYLKLFQNIKEETIIGEASTSYFSSKIAAKNIFELTPESKFVFLLRNPINRLHSLYMHRVKDGYIKLKGSFDEFIMQNNEFVEKEKYYLKVKRFIELFPKKNFYFCIFENLIEDIEQELTKIFSFLEIEVNYKPIETSKHNVGMTPRNKFISLILNPRYYRRLLPYIPNSIRGKIKRIIYKNKQQTKMDINTKKYLQSYFSEDIMKLSQLINQNLSFWL